MTSKLTRERIQEIINLACKTCSDGSTIYPKAYSTVDSKEIVGLARMALAAMDSEPVAYADPMAFVNFEAGNARREWMWKNPGAFLVPLYRHAQPAPETEREPIAWLNDAYLARGVVDGEAGSEDAGPGYIPVYREASPAQPAPVVSDETQSRAIFEKWCSVNIERNKWHPEFYAHLPAREQWAVWEACRAAMLNGGKS